VIHQILDAGFNFDFIDADLIDSIGIPYKILILPGVDRIPLQSYNKILDFTRHGGIVIATRKLPATAPGYQDAAAVSAQVQALSETLFHGHIDTAHFVPDEHTLGDSLATWLHPDFAISPRTSQIGFIHRHLPSGDLYFLANTSNQPRRVDATFRSGTTKAELWDPFTGKVTGVANPGKILIDLLPYESRIVYFSNAALAPVVRVPNTTIKRTDISHDWQVNFGQDSQWVQIADLGSWTESANLRNFSGTATYRRSIDVAELHSRQSVQLDFGEGTPVPMPDPLPHANMRAYLESPVRESAQVFVNDRVAGYVWHPPFRVEIAPYLKPGRNELRIIVGNTAINELAGTSLPSYRLLYDRYGVEFIPQGMQDLQPLPSGILRPVTLILKSSE
jgi:hypothetical protein